MAFKIGFAAEHPENKPAGVTYTAQQVQAAPRKSVVQVYFADRNMTLAYYNDQFDLHRGDMVYVDGKLEGLLGQVTQVNYSFKIKVSDYKRVVAQVNTDVSGRFFMMPSHFITFEAATLPPSQVLRWLKGPDAQEEAFVVGRDDFRFPLAELKEIRIQNWNKIR